MKIGGFQKVSLVDYPGKICAIVWTIGCNFRCKFCYNIGLVLPEKIKGSMPEDAVFSYLNERKGFLDAVEITGGEPTIYEDLPDFLKKIKNMGYLAKLDTNGTNPSMLKNLLEKKLVDYIAMDIKTVLDFERYNEIVDGILTKEMFEKIKESIKILLNSDIDYEFRTTLVKNFHSKEDIIEICKSIAGAKNYYLENFKYTKELVGRKNLSPFDEKEIEEIASKCKRLVKIKHRI